MARPMITTVTLAAASDTAVALSQSPSGAGNLILNGAAVSGGVASFAHARRIIITSSGNDSGVNFILSGTNGDSNPISETIAGANTGIAAASSDFKTISSAYISGAAAGTVKVGTNTTGSSVWYVPNIHAIPFNAAVAIVSTGTVTSTAEYTYDDPNIVAIPKAWATSGLTNITGSADTAFDRPVAGIRLTVTSGAGTAKLYVIQAGIKT